VSFYLNDKVESALVAIITPGVDPGLGITITTGKNSIDKGMPCIICWADGDGEEDPKDTGNFFINAEVQVKRSGVPNEDGTGLLPDPKVPDESLINAVFGPLLDDGLAASLSAAVPDFTVLPGGVFREAPKRGYNEEGAWVDSMALRLYCCGSSLAP
jgi:hypothetical protein